MTEELMNFLQNNKGESDPRNGWYRVTKPFAEELLRYNKNNARPLNKNKVRQIKKDIKLGKFEKNGESIAFTQNTGTNDELCLQDGQHRLEGAVEAFDNDEDYIWVYLIFDADKTGRYDCGANRQTWIETGLTSKSQSIATTVLRTATGETSFPQGMLVEFTGKVSSYTDAAQRIIYTGVDVTRELNKGRAVKIPTPGTKSSCGAVVAAMLRSGTMTEEELSMFFRVLNTQNAISCTKDASPISLMLDGMSRIGAVGGSKVQHQQIELTYQALMDFKEGKHVDDKYEVEFEDNGEKFIKNAFKREVKDVTI